MVQVAEQVNVLDDAQDIAVVGNLGKDRFVYAAKPSLQTQKWLYDISVSNPGDSQVPAYQRYWKFDEKAGIMGSSTWLDLRFDVMSLRPSGLWLPGLLEAKALEAKRKLENGVYRDYDVVFYNEKNPNEDIAEALMPEIEALKLQTPLVIPYRALNPIRNDKMSHGVQPSFVQSPEGIISGEEAERQINSLNYRGNSGVHGLDRDRNGFWDASWYGLDDSYENGRVDWICGEATREILVGVNELILKREFSDKIRKLESEREKRREGFLESLR